MRESEHEMQRRNFAAGFLPPSGGDRFVRSVRACMSIASAIGVPRNRTLGQRGQPVIPHRSRFAVASIHGRTTDQSTTPLSLCTTEARGEYRYSTPSSTFSERATSILLTRKY